MRLVEYKPEHFDLVRRAAERMGAKALCHRPFVDHYYASSRWCKLYLAMIDDEAIGATIGVDLMRFECESRSLTLGLGTNFRSLQPGFGGYLFMQWVKSCEVGFVFGGSGDTHRILEQQKWTSFRGVNTYYLNPLYRAEPGDSAWRLSAKWMARHLSPRIALPRRLRQIERDIWREISVQEEDDYDESLLPAATPFTFRFAPSPDYLRWRYNTRLSFVRYRCFRILASGRTVGYVILNDAPDRLIVSQCDGDDPAILAHGVLLSLAEASREDRRPREVVLTSCRPEMQRLYERFGFATRRRWHHPFALGLQRSRIEMPSDTSNWLINFDWGDNGLRAPFLDQT